MWKRDLRNEAKRDDEHDKRNFHFNHTKQINSWVYALKLCGSFENYLIQQKNSVMQQVRSFRKLRDGYREMNLRNHAA